MEIELPAMVVLGIKAASVLIGVIMLWRSRKELRKIWNWMPTQMTDLRAAEMQTRKSRPNMDVAWRQLIDDSRDSNCEKSIKLLNEWMAIRTHAGLIRKLPPKKKS